MNDTTFCNYITPKELEDYQKYCNSTEDPLPYCDIYFVTKFNQSINKSKARHSIDP